MRRLLSLGPDVQQLSEWFWALTYGRVSLTRHTMDTPSVSSNVQGEMHRFGQHMIGFG